MSDSTITIDAAGVARFIWRDDLAGLAQAGVATITRVSHVEPVDGMWMADLSPIGGLELGPFRLRGEAIAAEIEWLEANELAK